MFCWGGFRIDEEKQVICGDRQCEKRRKFNISGDSRLATLTRMKGMVFTEENYRELLGQRSLEWVQKILCKTNNSSAFVADILEVKSQLTMNANFLGLCQKNRKLCVVLGLVWMY